MIKRFMFENFKSFEKAELNLEAVTSIIGTNASGKSNAIEGIQILAEAATGVDLSVVLDGTRNSESHIRGGSSACCRFKKNWFKLGCLITLDDEYDLYYYIRISTNKRVNVEEEGLFKVLCGQRIISNAENMEKIFKTKTASKDSGDISTEYNDKKKGRNPDILCMRASSVLAQLKSKLPQNSERDKECLGYIELVIANLKSICVLNPIPKDMRDYVRITDVEIRENAENISPVLLELCQDTNKKKELLDVICSLPENEVSDIEFIKTELDDVIFGLREQYAGISEIVDAKKLSDGTLRCIAIVAAMLSVPPNSVLIVEEIDNGIHASRLEALIEKLSQIGEERKIDLILTTHNPVLLNGYDKEKLLGVSVIYRDKMNGSSCFASLVDINNYQIILAKGGIGDAMRNGDLIEMLKNPPKRANYKWLEV